MKRLKTIIALLLATCALVLGAAATASASTSSSARPAITQGACSNPDWVRVDLTNGGSTCFGFTGQTPLLSLAAYDFLPGNNYGVVWFNYAHVARKYCFGNYPGNCPAPDGRAQYGFYWDYAPYNYAVVQKIEIDGWN